MKLPLYSFITLLLISFSSFAQTSSYTFKRIVLDSIAPGYPSDLKVAGNKLFFSAKHHLNTPKANTLWATDGTQQGTINLYNSANPVNAFEPWEISEYNGKAIYNGISSLYGREPWISDGTFSGTSVIKNITKSALPSLEPSTEFTPLNGKMYFAATGDTFGRAVWVTDGTDTGTKMAKNIVTGKYGGISGSLTEFNGSLYFAANNDTTNGFIKYLFVYNPTKDTLRLLKDINNSNVLDPIFQVIQNGKLYFTANDNVHGRELWVTDGTEQGTYMVKDISTGIDSAFEKRNQFATFNNKVYFQADDGIHGNELWVTDGTNSGTYMIKDINPGPSNGVTIFCNMISYGSVLIFTGIDSTNGGELWSTDGTAAGTNIIKDMLPGKESSNPYNYTIYHGKVYFTSRISNIQVEVAVTDGTSLGSFYILNPNATSSLVHAAIQGFCIYNDELYFDGRYDNFGTQLWSIKDSVTTSIHTIANNIPNYSLYPNPAHHNFTIKTTEPFRQGSVTITDLAGRVVKTERLLSNSQTISIDGIAAGVYMAEVLLNDKRSTQKLLVE